MRVFPILAAGVASLAIYAFVIERDRLGELFAGDATKDDVAKTESSGETLPSAEAASTPAAINVVALKSIAREVDSAVIVRGQTEADRQVELRAETSGQIISEPISKGTFVERGHVLCQIDPGTRTANLAEATARLAEARARIPEARAQVPEAQARLEESRARVIEAKARLREAEINANAAEKLSTEGFASETRVAQTQAEVEGAKAQIVSAEAGLKAAQSGLETVAASIEAARAGVESAQAAVAAAEKEIERLTITAPFSGVLESNTAELGSFLQAGSLCATVLQLNPMKLVGYIPETEIGKLQLGAKASARLASGGDVTGDVVFISRAADPETRTFRIDIRVPNTDLSLRDGQTAEIEIEAAGTLAHLLPQSALTLDNNGVLGVRVVDDTNQAVFVPVSLMRDTPTGVFVVGLPEQADVLVIGQEFVSDGVPVNPTFREIGQ